jgi:hypothetical protein
VYFVDSTAVKLLDDELLHLREREVSVSDVKSPNFDNNSTSPSNIPKASMLVSLVSWDTHKLGEFCY